MRIKQDYIMKTIAGETVVVPIKEEAVRLNGIITLNKTGAYLFEQLQKANRTKDDLLALLLSRYDVDVSLASRDIDAFLHVCRTHGIIDGEPRE